MGVMFVRGGGVRGGVAQRQETTSVGVSIDNKIMPKIIENQGNFGEHCGCEQQRWCGNPLVVAVIATG